MRLYSLKQCKHFRYFNIPKELSSLSSVNQYSSTVAYEVEKITRVIHSEGKCFLTICDDQRSRTS